MNINLCSLVQNIHCLVKDRFTLNISLIFNAYISNHIYSPHNSWIFYCNRSWPNTYHRVIIPTLQVVQPVSAEFYYVPGGVVTLRNTVFRCLLAEKENGTGHVPASIAFWGQKAVYWDNPKPLKVSGIVLTSLRLGDQTRCLPV